MIFKRRILFCCLLLPQIVWGGINKECCEMTPDAGPRVCGLNVFLVADYILWSPRQDGLGFVRTGINPNGNAQKGSIHHPNWKWSSGFKGGIGINLPYDGWDVFGRYTYLRSSAPERKIRARASNRQLQPMWNIGGNLNVNSGLLLELDQAKADWRLSFNVVDLELGRNFFVSHFMSLRPSAGLKGTWQDQDYNIRYITTNEEILRMHMDQDFWGVGLRFGLDTTFHLTKKWSFFGNVYASGLWGKFDITRKDKSQVDANATSFTTLFQENSLYSLKPVLEALVGFRFDYWFCNNRGHFRLEAGWEEQLWFSQNQYIRVFEESAHGDLVMQGLTIEARIDF